MQIQYDIKQNWMSKQNWMWCPWHRQVPRLLLKVESRHVWWTIKLWEIGSCYSTRITNKERCVIWIQGKSYNILKDISSNDVKVITQWSWLKSVFTFTFKSRGNTIDSNHSSEWVKSRLTINSSKTASLFFYNFFLIFNLQDFCNHEKATDDHLVCKQKKIKVRKMDGIHLQHHVLSFAIWSLWRLPPPAYMDGLRQEDVHHLFYLNYFG